MSSPIESVPTLESDETTPPSSDRLEETGRSTSVEESAVERNKSAWKKIYDAMLGDKQLVKIVGLLAKGNQRDFKKAKNLFRARVPLDEPKIFRARSGRPCIPIEEYFVRAIDMMIQLGGKPTKQQLIDELDKVYYMESHMAISPFADDLFTAEYCAYCNISDASEDDVNLQHCSACKTALYCSPECQKKHWKKHKKVCVKVEVEAKNRKPKATTQA